MVSKTIKKKSKQSKNNNKLLEKEIDILRNAIEEEQKKKSNIAKNKIIKKIFTILENFLREKQLVCYGGTAINNILPKGDQFYDKNIELPDYDFFTPNALEDAKELADIYYKNGFDEVEAKSGVHVGTYKVFVNFIPIADITQLDSELFSAIQKNAIVKQKIHYAPPNYLRMAGYLELSRPDGDISRWEKVWKRLYLLNKNFPITNRDCNIKDFIKNFETPINNLNTIYRTVLDSIIQQKLVFFGSYALYSYGKYMSKNHRTSLIKNPDFDVLANDPLKSINIIKNKLLKNGIKNINIKFHNSVGEIIPEHYELLIDNQSIIFIYKTIACHSYNTITVNKKKVNIATIDTMLSFYLAFLFVNRDYYDPERILCICQYLFTVQIQNRLKQKGVLKRFTTQCYGKQETMESIRAHKAFLFNEFKNKQCSSDYQKYFLRYIPSKPDKCIKFNKTIKDKKKKIKKSKSKSKSKSKKEKMKKNKTLKIKVKKLD